MKKVLLLNGSPNKDKSMTMLLTNRFLDGVRKKEAIEVKQYNIYDLDIKPCKTCLYCMYDNPGTCVIKDDFQTIYAVYQEVDFVIWSFPIMFFSVPGMMKNVIERFCVDIDCKYINIGEGRLDHKLKKTIKKPCVVISSGGCNSLKNNYEGVRFMFDEIYSDAVCYAIVPGLSLLKEPSTKYLYWPIFNKITEAGYEYALSGTIKKETQDMISASVCDNETYARLVNNRVYKMDVSDAEKMQRCMDQIVCIYNIDEHKVDKPIVLEFRFNDMELFCQLHISDTCTSVCDVAQFVQPDFTVYADFESLFNKKISDEQSRKGSEVAKLIQLVERALSKNIHELKL